ncbi:MAG: amino acid adenylation domain-containing protein [Myxococcota bacterium]
MPKESASLTSHIAPGASLIERFANQAKRTPEAVAIRSGDATLTYAELAERSEAIAGALIRSGLAPGQRVAFSVERNERVLAFLLGILRAGGTYTPLDARLPKARLETIIEDIRPSLCLVDESFDATINVPDRVDAQALWQEVDPTSAAANETILPDLPSESIAYILFTSGSTGRPKGALISHRALDAFLVSIDEALERGPGDITLAGTPLSFDISVAELYLPLITGGTVLLSRAVDEPREICALCAEYPVRLMWTTPSKWRALLRAGLRAAPEMTAVTGGESLPPDLAERLLPLVGCLWNSYGPTEATVAATIGRIESATEPLTIGPALSSAQITIVDEHLGEVAPGEVGEILIGGPSVGSGYWERPELSERVFLRNPADAEAPTHYRSGDLGRQRDDGQIIFLGRRDRQVKVRGHRIELGEIEAAALTHPEINEAVADLRERKADDARLVLYYSTETGNPIPLQMLRGHLAERIPGHSVPQHFAHLENFPIAPSGKVDLAALPDPELELEREESEELIRPSTPFERRLHQLFCEELGNRHISIQDSFFDLGGHSIMAASIFAQMQADTGIDLPLARLVQTPTIEGLAALFEEHAEAQSSQPDWSGLVRFKQHAGPRAVFFIHAAGGNVLNYAPIAAQINDASVYGIQARGLDGRTPPPATFGEVARNYAEIIRKELNALGLSSAVICGGSFGGCVAVEVARTLRNSGVQIPLLILLDAIGPGVMEESAADSPSKRAFPRPSLKGLFARAKSFGRSLAALTYRVKGSPLPNPLRYNYLADRHSELLDAFRKNPESRRGYDGEVLLIRGPLIKSAGSEIYGDPDLGWSGVLTGEVERSYVDATHEVFVENPDTVQAVRKALIEFNWPNTDPEKSGPA